MAAFSVRPTWRSMAIPLNNKAVGLAIFFPAISGAVPCTASKMEIWSPILADGANPSPPTKPAHKSETISPCRFVRTNTSKLSGRVTNFIQRSSTIISSDFNSGYSFATS